MLVEGFKRYHLMHNTYCGSTWHIVDLAKASVGAGGNGKLSWSYHVDEYQGDTLTELLLNIYDAKDDRFYIVNDAILNDGTWRFDTYPLHCGLQPLRGVIRSYFTRKKPGEWFYGFGFVGELWVREKGVGYYKWLETIAKVEGFDMREEKKNEIEHYLETVKNDEVEQAEE